MRETHREGGKERERKRHRQTETDRDRDKETKRRQTDRGSYLKINIFITDNPRSKQMFQL